ncbi:cytochrome b5 domain-containing protein [Mariniluteicoccus flavus]
MWWKITLIVVAVLVIAGVAYAYLSPPDPNVGDPVKLQVTFSPEEQARIDTVTVSRAELAAATCDQGAKCYLAVNGVVYDMAAFPKWARGQHHGVRAGTDATEKFVGSSHAKAYLEKLPVVGRLGS